MTQITTMVWYHSSRARHPGIWSRPSEILLTTKLVEVTEFLLSYLISWEMMLLKCCTQYASKFGKLSNGHRTRRGQFSFQSQRKAMTKNVQTNIKLCSFHKPARLCSKFFTLGFSSMQTENFQMFKLVLEKAEEPEIKMPTSAGSLKKQRNSEN